MGNLKVAVNGYGVIGKRVADAITLQEDMDLIGIGDVAADWRIKTAEAKGYSIFANTDEGRKAMDKEEITVSGNLNDLLNAADMVVDCAPKKLGEQNVERYKQAGIKYILQGGEKHQLTGHSFSAESNYSSAYNRNATRVVSCNTTSIVRTLTSLKQAGLLKKARGTLLRRATDPWESHKNGIMNTLVPETEIPSHQGPDAQSVDPELDVVTVAVKVPVTLSHLHYWTIELTRESSKEEILSAFMTSARTAFIKMSDGLSANNTVKELMLDMGRPHGDMYEVAVFEDMLKVEGNELYFAYLVDNQAIVIPETIDAIRALAGMEADPQLSMEITNYSLDIRQQFIKKTKKEMV